MFSHVFCEHLTIAQSREITGRNAYPRLRTAIDAVSTAFPRSVFSVSSCESRCSACRSRKVESAYLRTEKNRPVHARTHKNIYERQKATEQMTPAALRKKFSRKRRKYAQLGAN